MEIETILLDFGIIFGYKLSCNQKGCLPNSKRYTMSLSTDCGGTWFHTDYVYENSESITFTKFITDLRDDAVTYLTCKDEFDFTIDGGYTNAKEARDDYYACKAIYEYLLKNRVITQIMSSLK